MIDVGQNVNTVCKSNIHSNGNDANDQNTGHDKDSSNSDCINDINGLNDNKDYKDDNDSNKMHHYNSNKDKFTNTHRIKNEEKKTACAVFCF